MPPLAITTISSRMLSVTTNHADCVDGVATLVAFCRLTPGRLQSSLQIAQMRSVANCTSGLRNLADDPVVSPPTLPLRQKLNRVALRIRDPDRVAGENQRGRADVYPEPLDDTARRWVNRQYAIAIPVRHPHALAVEGQPGGVVARADRIARLPGGRVNALHVIIISIGHPQQPSVKGDGPGVPTHFDLRADLPSFQVNGLHGVLVEEHHPHPPPVKGERPRRLTDRDRHPGLPCLRVYGLNGVALPLGDPQLRSIENQGGRATPHFHRGAEQARS